MLIGHSISDALGRILAVDHGICELLHRSEAELVGMTYASITHADDVAWNVALIDKLEANGGPLTIRKRYLRPGTASVWSDVQVSRLSAGPDQGRLVGTINRVDPREVKLTPEMLWRSACKKELELRSRRAELGHDLFGDYPWLILLQLYKAEAEGACVSLKQISASIGCREQTLARWLKVLEDKQLVDCFHSEICAGQLTSLGIVKVENLLNGTVEN